MSELLDEDDEDEDDSAPEPPHVDEVVVTARGGFQPLNGSNPAFKAVFEPYPALANGTAGKVVRIPSAELPEILRSLAKLLEQEFQHAKSNSAVRAAAGIDNWGYRHPGNRAQPVGSARSADRERVPERRLVAHPQRRSVRRGAP